MSYCTNCDVLKYQIEQLENIMCTLEQENRQQHARNQRQAEELLHAENIIGELREAKSLSYNQIKESFMR